jgi:hypothetical protein
LHRAAPGKHLATIALHLAMTTDRLSFNLLERRTLTMSRFKTLQHVTFACQLISVGSIAFAVGHLAAILGYGGVL